MVRNHAWGKNPWKAFSGSYKATPPGRKSRWGGNHEKSHQPKRVRARSVEPSPPETYYPTSKHAWSVVRGPWPVARDPRPETRDPRPVARDPRNGRRNPVTRKTDHGIRTTEHGPRATGCKIWDEPPGEQMDRYLADTLFTMSDGQPPVSSGIVDVEDGRVVWSGPASKAPDIGTATVHRIDGILMPGMVNTHCHTPMVLLRGAGEGLPVDQWLHEVMWPREARLTTGDVRVAMQMGAAELLSNGITTSVEMYFHGDAVARGATEAGLRCVVTAPVIEDAQLDRFGSWEAQLDEMVSTRDRWDSNDLIEVGLGPHAAYSLSDECLRRVVEIAQDTGMLVHIHVAEEEWEDTPVRERSGVSAPAYLEAIGLLEARVLAAHAVWMSDEDIEIFGRHGVSVAHCPCSNSKHGSGIARVRDLLEAGVRVGIGTDGPASHHRLDLFEEMRTAIRLARIKEGDAGFLPAHQALHMVTAGAADAIDRPDLGRLVAGSWADMVAISPDEAALHPVIPGDDDPVSRIVWSGSPKAVRSVWVGGRKVVQDGRVTSIDVDVVRADMTRRARRLAG